MTPDGLRSERRRLLPPCFPQGLNETVGFDGLANANRRRDSVCVGGEIQVGESARRSVTQSDESQRRETHVPDFKDASARKLKSLIRSERMVDKQTKSLIRQHHQPSVRKDPEATYADQSGLDALFLGSQYERLLHLAAHAPEAVSNPEAATDRST
jgi:hypothetical protein